MALNTVYQNIFLNQSGHPVMSGLGKIIGKILTWDLKEKLPMKNKNVHKKCRGTIYCSGICKMGAVRALEVLLQPFLRWYQPSAEKLWHFENSRSLWKLVPTRSTSISPPPPPFPAFSRFSAPWAFFSFSYADAPAWQTLPLHHYLHLPLPTSRQHSSFFFYSIAALRVVHAIKMSAVLK